MHENAVSNILVIMVLKAMPGEKGACTWTWIYQRLSCLHKPCVEQYLAYNKTHISRFAQVC